MTNAGRRRNMKDWRQSLRKYDTISLNDIKYVYEVVGLLHGNQTWNIHNSIYSTAVFYSGRRREDSIIMDLE